MAADEGDDYRVVELPRDGDEVGNEIERQREVADEAEEKQLARTGNARVTSEPGDEDDAVRDEGGERPRLGAPAEEDERDDERGVDDHRNRDSDEEPLPPRHARNLILLRTLEDVVDCPFFRTSGLSPFDFGRQP